MKFGFERTFTVLAFLFLFFSTNKNYAQVNKDSLMRIWNDKTKHDTVRLNALMDVTWYGYLYTRPDSAVHFAHTIIRFAIKHNLLAKEAEAYNLEGIAYDVQGKFPQAINCYYKSIALKEKLGDNKGIANTLNNIGLIYSSEGNFIKAIECYRKSLKILEKLGLRSGVASLYANISIIYRDQGDLKKALEYQMQSVRTREEIKDTLGMADSYISLGNIYLAWKNSVKAIKFYEKALTIYKLKRSELDVSLAYNCIGEGLICQKKYDMALEYYFKALAIREKIGANKHLATILVNIGSAYMNKGENKKAIDYSLKAFEQAKKVGVVLGIREASKMLYLAYSNVGKFKQADEMFELYVKIKDSISSADSKKELVRQEFKYKYEKKAAADSVRALTEQKLTNAKLSEEQTLRYVLYVGLFLTIVFSVFMFNRFRITRRQKFIIEDQKQLVEMQKELVEAKQREVMDSIHYAKRIQEALLPSAKSIERNLSRLSKRSG